MWQPTPILFPDVELWASGFLRSALRRRTERYTDGVFVGNEVPTSRAERMVIVRRDGGQQSGLRDNPRLSVRVWAETKQDASDLARMVVALMAGAADGRPVLSVRHQSGPTSVPDQSKQHQLYLVFDVATRGVALNEGA